MNKISIQDIFNQLNNQNIRYCNWKSNEHLDDSFNGKCDFDILVHEDDVSIFQKKLLEFGFKFKFSTANYVYPGMEDYLWFDENTGILHHFHVHYKLIVGEKYKKNYRIPIESQLLRNTQYASKYPIKIPKPEYELTILVIRAILKFSFNKKTLKRLILKRKILPNNILKEFYYLIKFIDKDQFEKVFKDIFPQLDWLLITFPIFNPSRLNPIQIQLIKFRLLNRLKIFKIADGRTLALNQRIRRNSAKLNYSWVSKGGISVAFVGIDGSGKTTTINEINNWLMGKISHENYYMGLPKKKIVWKILTLISRILKKIKFKFFKKMIDVLRFIYNARFKYRNYRQAFMSKNQGKLVIYERFPFKVFWNKKIIFDGPFLKPGNLGYSIEKSYYKKIGEPDYTFVIYVDPNIAIKRKPEHHTDFKKIEIHQKNELVEKLIKSGKNNLFVINNSSDRDSVILEIKRKIWSLL